MNSSIIFIADQWIRPVENQLLSTDLLVIYGAGNFGKDLCQFAQNKGYKVLAFLDQKAVPGQILQGIPVLLPDSKELTTRQKHDSTVLVAIHNRDVNIIPIITSLIEMGFERILNPVELYDIFSDQLGNRFWLTSPLAYKNWQEEIAKVYSLWEDDTSRSIYMALLTQRIKGDYSVLNCPDPAHQYFPPNLPPWKYPLRLIDCGAYDGDTFRQMKTQDIAVESVVAFEPDLENFKKLSRYISTEWNSPTLLFSCGVHSTTGQLKFASDGGEGGKLSESGSTFIQAVALDDVLNNFHPSLIKMDIEGAEIEGLMGAQKVIRQDRPGLAICVYHCPQHLWQIPEMIKKWDCGYIFYLRTHAYNGFEVVLYTVQS